MSKLIKENWYKGFFSKYYLQFLGHKKNSRETKQEVKFICRILGLSKGEKILDLACGSGRHTVELAKRGFNVTGLDFDKQLLGLAKKLAKRNNVILRLIKSDMRIIPYKNEFSAIINMFSSFGYFSQEKENFKVLKAVSSALKKNGLFLLDLPNKNWLLTKVPKKIWQKVKNNYLLEERFFDKRRKIYFNKIIVITPHKKIKHINTLMRLYDLPEIEKKLNDAGLEVLKVYGNYKEEKFKKELSPRMIILAQKRSKTSIPETNI